MNPIKLFKDYLAAKPLIDFVKGIDMKSSLFSWKTTIAGLVTLGVPVAAHFGWLDMQQSSAVMAVAASFGFIMAKDATK